MSVSLRRAAHCAVVAGAAVSGALVHGAQTAGQPPTIRAGVDVVVVDVQVVDRQGAPIATLRPEDFEVTIGGRRRRVLTTELVEYGSGASAASGVAAPAPVPAAPASAQGRRFILAVDEQSFTAASARAAMEAAGRFIDRLEPRDLLALQTYPTGAARTDLTTDHASVRRLLDRIVGMLEPPLSHYKLTRPEVTDIASGDTDALARAAERECGAGFNPSCRKAILMEAQALAGYLEAQIAQSLNGLRGLVRGIDAIEGRKVLVLISGGLFASDRAGGRVNMGSEIRELGREAAAADATLYALHMDSTFLDAFARGRVNLSTLFRDTNALAAGLEQVAGAAGGAVIRVQGGTADRAFDRVLRENSAYYLLGVEIAQIDRDGEPHPIRVRVRERGATVRHRMSVIVPRSMPESP